MERTAKLSILLTLVLVFPASTLAQGSCEEGSAHAFVFLTTAQTPWDGCTVVMDAAPTTVVSVVAGPHVPMTKVRFSIQDPSFGVILDATWDYPFVGTPQTGVEITLPECTSGQTTVLGQMLVFADISAIDGSCVEWTVDDNTEIEDCTGAVRPSLPRHTEFSTAPGCCGYIDCASIPPYDLYPPDGATGVPIDVELSWTGGYGLFELNISSDPECYTGQTFNIQDAYSFAPDFLEHNTTYHWQVGWSDGLECGGGSPRFSFTTMGPVPTETSTWGRIKALYR